MTITVSLANIALTMPSPITGTPTPVRQARLIRLARGLTLQQVADSLGIGIDTVSAFERGLSDMRSATLRDLARVLGCPIEALLVEVPAPARVYGLQGNPPGATAQAVLAARSELEGGNITMMALGLRLGVTRERIRQIAGKLGIQPQRPAPKPYEATCSKCGRQHVCVGQAATQARWKLKHGRRLVCPDCQRPRSYQATCTWCGTPYTRVGEAATAGRRYARAGHRPTCPSCFGTRSFVAPSRARREVVVLTPAQQRERIHRRREQQRAYYQRHRIETREQQRAYYQRHREQRGAYYQRHRERILAQQKVARRRRQERLQAETTQRPEKQLALEEVAV